MAGGNTSLLGAVWQLVQYLFLFGLVLALAYASTRGLRRLASPGRGRHLRLLDQLHLGNNRSFYLIALGGRVVLVAMGEGGVAAITTLDDPDVVAELLNQPAAASGAPLLRGGAAPLREGLERWLAAGQGTIGRLLRNTHSAPSSGDLDFAQLLRSAEGAAGAGSARLQAQVARLRRLVEKAEA